MRAGTGLGSSMSSVDTGHSSGTDTSLTTSSHLGLGRESGGSPSSMPRDTGSRSGPAVASMHSYNSSTVWRGDAEEQEVVNSNATGMQISFLGTAGSLSSRTRQVPTLCIACMHSPQQSPTRLLLPEAGPGRDSACTQAAYSTRTHPGKTVK